MNSTNNKIPKSDFHVPVLLDEAMTLLNIKPDGTYVDCTFGRGGHAFKIIEKLSPKGKLICFDCDQEAISYFNKNNNNFNCEIIYAKFSLLEKELKQRGIKEVDGILFDLGVSSPQLDNLDRGFSYMNNNYLDMRMDQSQIIDANYILKNYSYEQLNEVFKKYAEDWNPQRISKNIIRFREEDPSKLFFSNDLVNIIRDSIDRKKLYKKKFPENKYFQAIRIEVNNELWEIRKAIESSFNLLAKNGRLVVISFHSLEDKIVKEIFFEKSKKLYPKEIPIIEDLQEFKIINIKMNQIDKIVNSRAKSSKIRCIERC
ncbi:MAG: 16S rRNA (cytosine(1402)-N(4))-methyltransferase RsmH [Mycoplasmoidaceae bacterium]